ncbi:MAG: DNA primase, partial [Spirochaetales bacterium]
MGIPDSVIRQISEKIDFLELVGKYTTLHKLGDRYRGLCPFHQEKTPSFYVQPDKKLFYCFGCGKGGNLFQFFMEIEHISFPEALKILGEKVGISIDSLDESSLSQGKKQDALLQLLNKVAGAFHYLLMKSELGKEARQYLEQRGIENAIIEKFQLGYAPSDPYWLRQFLEKKSFSAPFLVQSGLFSPRNPERSFFVDRLMFPIFSLNGDVVAFGGRILKGEGPKYLNSAESALFKKGETLYGFYQARESLRKSQTAVLAEGYMDVLALHQAGIDTAVAPLGTSLTLSQVRLIRRFAEKVILFFDSDPAGLQALKRASILCEQQELEVLGVDTGNYPFKDPAEFIQQGKKDELQKIVKYPISILEFLLRTLSPQENQLKVTEVFPYIESMVSEIKRDTALSQIADYFQLDRESVRADFLPP